MANPLHNLEDRLRKLQTSKDGIETEIKAYTKLLNEVKANILLFKNAIHLLKKGE